MTLIEVTQEGSSQVIAAKWLQNYFILQVLNAASVNVGAFISNHMRRWLAAMVCYIIS